MPSFALPEARGTLEALVRPHKTCPIFYGLSTPSPWRNTTVECSAHAPVDPRPACLRLHFEAIFRPASFGCGATADVTSRPAQAACTPALDPGGPFYGPPPKDWARGGLQSELLLPRIGASQLHATAQGVSTAPGRRSSRRCAAPGSPHGPPRCPGRRRAKQKGPRPELVAALLADFLARLVGDASSAGRWDDP